MNEKKITFRLSENQYERFRSVFPEGADHHIGGAFVSECLNMFRNTLLELKGVFNRDEIGALVDITNTWLMDFSQFSARQMLLHELEDYFRLEQGSEFPPEFREKIESLTEFQVYVLLRQIKADWKSEDVVGESEKLFC